MVELTVVHHWNTLSLFCCSMAIRVINLLKGPRLSSRYGMSTIMYPCVELLLIVFSDLCNYQYSETPFCNHSGACSSGHSPVWEFWWSKVAMKSGSLMKMAAYTMTFLSLICIVSLAQQQHHPKFLLHQSPTAVCLAPPVHQSWKNRLCPWIWYYSDTATRMGHACNCPDIYPFLLPGSGSIWINYWLRATNVN